MNVVEKGLFYLQMYLYVYRYCYILFSMCFMFSLEFLLIFNETRDILAAECAVEDTGSVTATSLL